MKLSNKFPFMDKPNTATFVCCHVLNKERPILRVTHDEDGYWQFLCGGNHNIDDAQIVSLQFAYELDKSVAEVANMDYGHIAERKDKDSEWVVL